MLSKYKITLAALGAMLFWGMSFVGTKVALKYYDPIAIIFLRLVISVIFLYAFIKITGKTEKIQRSHIKIFLLLTFFEPFMYFLGESFGLTMVSSTLSSVIISTIPVFTPIAAFFILKERLTLANFVGLFLSFIGVSTMVVNRDFSFNAPIEGILLLFLAVFSAMGYIIVLKKLSHIYSTLTIILLQNTFGILYFLPFFIGFDAKAVAHTPLHWELVIALISLAVFASSLAFILFTKVIRELGVNKTNAFTNLIPVFTAIFSWLIIGETFTWQKIGGMCIVLTGVTLAQWNSIKAKVSGAKN